MTKKAIVDELLETKIIAILRFDSSDHVYDTAMALLEGGIKAIEVTMGTPNVLNEISKLAQHKDILPGVGSVINAEMAKSAIEAGAEFVVTPTSKKEVIDMAHELGKPVLSGAFTPSEILQAFEWGADIVKLFPAGNLGLSYFKAVKGPLPFIPLMPTGGVTSENAAEWIENGAVCLGVGSNLTNSKLIEQGDFKGITAIAKEFRSAVDGD